MNSDTSMSGTLDLLNRMKEQLPNFWEQTQVVGTWVWLEFKSPPSLEIRRKLHSLRFRWNPGRNYWQHPCGTEMGRRGDPRTYFRVQKGAEIVKSNQGSVGEYKVVALRECPLPDHLRTCENPAKAAEYWALTIATADHFDPERECFVVLLLNTRRRVKGHQLVSIGTLDTILVTPREVFRLAIVASAAAIIVMHNHPSGDPSPSTADIAATRDLMNAGKLLKIEVIDHVIVSSGGNMSLRETGCFY